MKFQNAILLNASLSALLASAWAMPTAAQDVSAQARAPGEAANADAQAEQAEATDIVVTGSRIARSGFNSPTPTLIVTAEQLELTAPDGLTQGLVKLPIFNASGGATGANGGRTLGSGGVNQTGNFLNLRNFGTIRTLILLDGRRVPPSNFDGNVDVDTLPQALVQRVDVVTGGASAVYGSDAVTGVVNYVLDRKYSGVKGVLQNGISGYGDNHKVRANVAVGTSLFGDRGHFIGSIEYSKTGGVATKESRPWFRNQLLVGSGTAGNPVRLIDNGVNNNASYRREDHRGSGRTGRHELQPRRNGQPVRTSASPACPPRAPTASPAGATVPIISTPASPRSWRRRRRSVAFNMS